MKHLNTTWLETDFFSGELAFADVSDAFLVHAPEKFALGLKRPPKPYEVIVERPLGLHRGRQDDIAALDSGARKAGANVVQAARGGR
jgi:hypothetical protein